tara:strand:- start:35 stop:553 length:519 start_codon:yes stop_codon:yes gene_type:complete
MESKRSKYNTIYHWKYRGVKYNDFDELYYIYIRTLKCFHCNKDFKNSTDRCLDHDHETGLFRAIVCKSCNNMDSYINYPNGYIRPNQSEYMKKWKEDNKDKVEEYYKNRDKEKELSTKKIYYQKNKDKILTKNKIKFICSCGTKLRLNGKNRHVKSKQHLKYMFNRWKSSVF